MAQQSSIYQPLTDPLAPEQPVPPSPLAPGGPAPLQPPPSSIYSTLGDDEQLARTVGQAQTANADTAARVLALQRKTGLPGPVIARNLAEIERQAATRDFDAAKFRRESPHLAAWLQEDENQAASANDDLANLGLLEWLLTTPQRAFARGQAQVELGQLRSASLFRSLTEPEHRRVEQLKRDVKAGGALGVPQDEYWSLRGAVAGAAEQLPMLIGGVSQGAWRASQGGVAGAAAATLAGQVPPLLAAPEEAISVPVMTGAGMLAGWRVGAAEFAFQVESGLALDEYLEFKDELGKTIDPDTARAAAIATGAVNAGLEVVGLESLLRLAPGADALGRRLSRSAVKEALRSPTVRAALGQLVKRYAGNLTLETGVEVAQEAVLILGGEIGKAASGAEGLDPQEIASRLAQTAVESAQAFSLLSLPGPVVNAAGNVRAAREAEGNKAFFQALGEGVANSKTAARSPEALQSFLARVTKDGPITDLYAPVDTWTTYWQSKNIDPAQMATELTGDAEAYARAVRQGTDLVIPTATYAATLAGTEHNTFFQSELRLGAQLPNAREAKASRQALEARLQAAMDAATAEPAEGSPARQALQTELEARGLAPDEAARVADLHGAVFGTVAERAGVSEAALVAGYPIAVTRPGGAGLDPTAAAAGIPASTAPETETGEQRVARRAGQYRALSSAIVRDAVAQDPTVDVAALEDQIAYRLDLHEAGQDERASSGTDPGNLLRAIAEFGGIRVAADKADRGEILRWAVEGLDQRKRGTVMTKHGERMQTFGGKTWQGVAGVFDVEGTNPRSLTLDAMTRSLMQDPRFNFLEDDLNNLLDALENAFSPGAEQHDPSRFPGTDDLASLGIRLGERWWERGAAAATETDDIELGDAVDTGEGDTSFEFEQGPAQRARELFQPPVLEYAQPRKGGRTGQGGRRGYVKFAAGRGPRRFEIGLFKAADPSTPLHELGHVYLEVLGDMASTLAAQDQSTLTAPQQGLVADYQAFLSFLGVTSRDEIQTEHHEKFARAFETYLFEGTAPSVELRSAFASFAAWLKRVYRSITALDVELSPEVRALFDRLVASDEAIATAQSEAEVTPLFTDALTAGMSEIEFAAYQDETREAHVQEEATLRARALADITRAQQSWWTKAKDEMTATVTTEVQADPVYRAMSVMRTGVYPDGTPFVEGQDPAVPIKLSRDSLVAHYGKAILAQLPRPYLYAKASGIWADAAAELFGYSSGDELLQALIEAVPLQQAVAREVDRRMRAEYGDVFEEGRLAEEAAAIVQGGEQRQRIVAAELAALTKGLARDVIPPAAVINEMARRQVAGTKIRDLRPGLFLQAARRASRQAFSLLSSGQDRAGAVRAKYQELVNLALYREAREAQDRVESQRRTLRGYRSTAARQRFGKAGADYLTQIDALLDRYELAHVTQKELAGRLALQAFVTEQQELNVPIEMPQILLDESRRINYVDVAVAEFTDVYEAVEHLARLARLKNELLKSAKKRTFEDARDTLVGSIQLHNPLQPTKVEFRPADARQEAIAAYFAAHKKMSFLAKMLDGYQDGGEMWEQIMRPVNEAGDAEAVRKEAAIKTLDALFTEAYPGRELGRLNDKLFIKAIGTSLSKEGRLLVALNWGNEDNQQRLLNDPKRRWNRAQVEAILETLDQRDWTFVTGVWQYVDSFWPEIAAKQQRVTGLMPEKVVAVPFDSKFGPVPGGYFPISYDSRLVARAGVLQAAGEATLKTFAAYVSSTSRRGHVEARKKNVQMSVRLDFTVLFNHVEQVIHDLTHHEMLIDVNRLLEDRTVQAAIVDTRGHHVYQQFVKGMEDVALGATPGKSVLERAANFVRGGTQVALLGMNFWTALQQPLGLFNGAQQVGKRWVLSGMKRWLRDTATMQSTVGWIHSRSPFMKDRATGGGTQDLQDLRAALSQPGGWFDVLLRTATFDHVNKQNLLNSYLWHIGQAQKIADVPTWLGAYEKHMAQGEPEARAIAMADQAVRDAQGSGRIADLAQVQRGSPAIKLFMTFYSYGNLLFNQTVEAYGRTEPSLKRPGTAAAFVGHLSLLYLFPALGLVLWSRALGRTGGDDDEEDAFLVEVAREMLSSAANTMVGVREMAGLADEGVRGYAGPAGTRLFQASWALGQQIKQGELDEGLKDAAMNVSGILFRYPAGQVQKTVDGIVALYEGRTRNPAALLVGPPREKR